MSSVAQQATQISPLAPPFPDRLDVGPFRFSNVSSLSGEDWAGLGEISIDSFPLRSSACPMNVDVRSPEGVVLTSPVLKRVRRLADGVELEFSLSKEEGGPAEWMLHTVRPAWNTSDWARGPIRLPITDTRLGLVLRYVEKELAGRVARGFTYQWRYSSQTIPIYRMLDRSTWEPGGHATGNELWFRCPFTESITRFDSVAEELSTQWFLPQARNPRVFQFLPLQTACQGFSLTFCGNEQGERLGSGERGPAAGRSGALMTWATRVSHVRTLIEKSAHRHVISHWHEHCGDLSYAFNTVPMEVLWFEGEFDRVDRMNLYESLRDYVSRVLHSDAGLREERVKTYGVMEQWDLPDLERYASEGLPKLAEAGVKTVMIPNEFANNMNEYSVGNMCCTTDWYVPDSVGEEKLTALCRRAKELGVEVEMWGNTALSTIAYQVHVLGRYNHPGRIEFPPEDDRSIWPALRAARDPWLRNPTGQIESDHYSPVFVCLNLRDESVRKLWKQKWDDAYERIGLGGIFLDSSFNLSSDKFHWLANSRCTLGGVTADQVHLHSVQRDTVTHSSAILSQYHAHLDLVREMQRTGYRYSGEDNGLFGVNRGGPSSTRAARTLHLWGNAILSLDPVELVKSGLDPDDILFRGLAYRVMWFVFWQHTTGRISWYQEPRSDGQEGEVSAWQRSILRAFNVAEPYMRDRRVTGNEGAVTYTTLSPAQVSGRATEGPIPRDRVEVVWSFGEGEIMVDPAARIEELTTGQACRSVRGTVLELQRHRVYLIRSVTSDSE